MPKAKSEVAGVQELQNGKAAFRCVDGDSSDSRGAAYFFQKWGIARPENFREGVCVTVIGIPLATRRNR
jgi:hypothetical protein